MAGIKIEQFEQFSKKIEQGDTVSKPDIEAAHAAAIDEVMEDESMDSSAKREKLLRMHSLKEKFLRDISGLKEGTEAKKEVVRDTTRMKQRAEEVKAARLKAAAMTDPNADGARIDDYEGWSWVGEDEDAVNKTRSTLSGWLAAHRMQQPGLEDSQYEKAYQIYENADDGILNFDDILEFEPMIEGMGMKLYLNNLSGYQLASEPMGYLAGFMALADSGDMLGGRNAEYKDYVISELNRLQSAGLLEYKGEDANDANDDQTVAHMKKGMFQMLALSQIEPPREWISRNAEIIKQLSALKQKAKALEESLDMKFKNPSLVEFINSDQKTWPYYEQQYVKDIELLIKLEAFEKLEEMKKESDDGLAKAMAEYEEVKKLDEGVDALTDEEKQRVVDWFKTIEKNLSQVSLAQADSLDKIVDMRDLLVTVSSDVRGVQEMVDGMKSKIESKKEAERKKKEEEKNKGEEPGTTPGGPGVPEKKEVFANLDSFILAKHLEEVKLLNEGRGYFFNFMTGMEYDRGSKKVSLKNSDVNKHFGPALQAYHDVMIDINEGRGADVSSLMPQLFKGLSQKPPAFFAKKLDANSLKSLINPLDIGVYHDEFLAIFAEALNDSAMEFNSRPTLDEMQIKYAEKFVPAWQIAGQKLSRLVANQRAGKRPPQQPQPGPSPMPAPAPGPQTRPELQQHSELSFLGGVYPEYTDALLAIARNPNNAQFQVPFRHGTNLSVLPCFMKNVGDGVTINYSGGSYRYSSHLDAMRDINSGEFHRKVTQTMMHEEYTYKPFEEEIGTVDEIEFGNQTGGFVLELDWTNPDAEVWVMPLPHGRMSVKIVRENVGIHGEEERFFHANNLRDLMRKLAHCREWAEGEDHSKNGREEFDEFVYDYITDPRNIITPRVEAMIGRVHGFDVQKNGVVKLWLDWGGGNSKSVQNNASVSIWAGNDGTIKYILNAKGLGVLQGKKTAAHFDDLTNQIMFLKSQARQAGGPAQQPTGGFDDNSDPY